MAGNAATQATKSVTLDTAIPTYSSATIDTTNKVVKLTFSDGTGTNLNSGVVPATSAFTFTTSSGSAISATVNTVTIDNASNTVTLNLASATGFSASGDKVLYTQPGSNKLSDVAGNLAATFASANTMTNITSDTTAPAAPTLALATASDTGPSTSDKITYDDTPTITVSLSGSSGTTAPVVGDVVKVYLTSVSAGNLVGTGQVTSVTSNAATVTITTSTLGASGAKSLVATSTDAKGNVSSTSTALAITLDTVTPVLSTAAVSGSSLLLTYTEAGSGLYTTTKPATSDFTVLVNGVAATVSSIAATSTTVTLTLSTAVTDTDTVLVSFTQGSNKLQDIAGNLASNLTSQIVTNNTAPPAPTPSLNNDTGSGTSDKTTNDATIFVPDLATGAYLQYSFSASGPWTSLAVNTTTFTPSASTGAQTIYVRQVNANGVTSANGSLAFTYDYTAPTAATLALTSDT